MSTTLTAARVAPHEVMALQFLSRGPDCIGVVDTEEKLAAAMVFIELQKRGLVIGDPSDDGPVWSILSAGRAALQDAEAGDGE